MRLGGFVIHGNSADTLQACLTSLQATCDDVVAVDSESTDGSAALVRRCGVRAVTHPWAGYGAARATAARALAQCDFIFYLDSDERMGPAAIEALKAWKQAAPAAARGAVLPINDWAELNNKPFVFRTHHRARLMRGDLARWTGQMIVHESLSLKNLPFLKAPIEHRFAREVSARALKEETYALLWALQAYVEGRPLKWVWPQRPAMFLKDALVKGALFRGGMAGARLAWAVSKYHQRKYQRLAEFKAGQHQPLVDAMRLQRFAEVCVLASTYVAKNNAAASPTASNASSHQ
jgi:glycosyltransferase involved in cell wall biosynthesis